MCAHVIFVFPVVLKIGCKIGGVFRQLESGRQIHHHCRCIHAECPSLRSQGGSPFVKLCFHVVFQRDQTRCFFHVTPQLVTQLQVANNTWSRIEAEGWYPVERWWQPLTATIGCVWKCCVTHCTQWFCWSLSLLNGYFIGNINPTFSDKPNGCHLVTIDAGTCNV